MLLSNKSSLKLIIWIKLILATIHAINVVQLCQNGFYQRFFSGSLIEMDFANWNVFYLVEVMSPQNMIQY